MNFLLSVEVPFPKRSLKLLPTGRLCAGGEIEIRPLITAAD